MRLAISLAVLAALFGPAAPVAQVASPAPQASPTEWNATVQKHLLDRMNKSKPAMLTALKKAQAAGMTGDVLVHVGFVIGRDGRIQSTQVAKSSGNAGIDGIAEEIVKRASPLPAIPAAIPGDTQSFTLPIRFRAEAAAKK